MAREQSDPTPAGTSGSSGTSAAITPAVPASVTHCTVTAGTQSSLDATGSADPATAVTALSGQPDIAVQELSIDRCAARLGEDARR